MESPRPDLRNPQGLTPITAEEFISEAVAEGRLLESAELEDVALRDASLIENCQIGELDLGSAKVRRMAFQQCTVEALVLTGAQLEDVNLRDAELRHITGIEHLRGATVSTLQLKDLAPHLAARLVISICD